jgi:hypothetical protein
MHFWFRLSDVALQMRRAPRAEDATKGTSALARNLQVGEVHPSVPGLSNSIPNRTTRSHL